MTKLPVLVTADVILEWQCKPIEYRVYVGDDLFLERTWIWDGYYLEERLSINAPPGKYNLRWELVPPAQGTIEVKNIKIERGTAYAEIENSQLRITDEGT
jgi:hypothetical protein